MKSDLWIKDLAPSHHLRKWFHEDKEQRWEQFVVLYKEELKQSAVLEDFVETVKKHKTITLLTATKDETRNYTVVLKQLLDRLINKY
ncbi:DUF488 domain-containing protein [Massilibacteroides vaginae]|uniref:DUF488 domain-containing protein n=1 Tax=Massilibacteroides vaginae TaxID=1673718 RepID=UPI00293731F6|nr:DUF488 family protein [Massilibacteroides vaginae]